MVELLGCTPRKVKIHRYTLTSITIDTTKGDVVNMAPVRHYEYVIEAVHKGVKGFFYILSDEAIEDFTDVQWTKSSVDPILNMGGMKIQEDEEQEEVEETELSSEVEADVDSADSDSSDGGDGGSSGGDGGGDGGD